MQKISADCSFPWAEVAFSNQLFVCLEDKNIM